MSKLTYVNESLFLIRDSVDSYFRRNRNEAVIQINYYFANKGEDIRMTVDDLDNTLTGKTCSVEILKALSAMKVVKTKLILRYIRDIFECP